MKSVLCLLLSGKSASGKGTVAQMIRDYFGSALSCHFTFSDPLGRGLDRKGLPRTRLNYQTYSRQLFDARGEEYLRRVIVRRARSAIRRGATFVVLDGGRWPEDVHFVRNELGEDSLCITIYLLTDRAERYRRVLYRVDGKIGENSLTFDAFCREDSAWTETSIDLLGAIADYTIPNEHTLQELKQQVDLLLDSIVRHSLKAAR